MATTTKQRHSSRLTILRTGDRQSRFYQQQTPKEILDELGRPRYLLSSSAKAEKSTKVGVLNRVLYLVSGVFCPQASPGCLSHCLGFSSGRMGSPMATAARDRRTALFVEDREHFLAILRQDIRELQVEAVARQMIPAVRLNGTSDLAFEELHPELFGEFAETQFFDYTKRVNRMHRFLQGEFPPNYHLTFSLSEKNGHHGTNILDQGGNVAAVFSPWVPDAVGPYQVINGDAHDARFLDPPQSIVGLKAKGLAREDSSGFVLRTSAA